jgi:thioredoxin-dependent peroxiredoxin
MATHKLQIGDKLPHFIMFDDNRQPIDISCLTGRFLVLYFYPKDNTPGCVREAISFRNAFNNLINAGAVVYGVSNDTPVSHRQFKQKFKLPFSLLSDTDGELRILMGVPSGLFGLIPGRVTYVFDPEGRLIREFKSQLSPEKHVKEALEVILRK